MRNQYQIFISSKHLDETGTQTRDSQLARQLYEYLSGKGLIVFQSNVSLEKQGISDYQKAIDEALDASKILIAVGTSRKNLDLIFDALEELLNNIHTNDENREFDQILREWIDTLGYDYSDIIG